MKTEALVEFIGVTKICGDVRANDNLSFTITEGSIHGIIGENGAGKSTAVKILFGLKSPDSGEVRLRGKPIAFRNPQDAIDAGIGMVHQHFMLAEPLTALDNLLLSHDGKAWHLLNREKSKKHFQDLAERYGFSIDWDSPVENLSVGAQQRLEILKVLADDTKIIILDEPTAVLTPQEVQDFFKQLRRLKAEGRTIVIITHKLREILEITDEVTVFRKGASVARLKTSQTSFDELAEHMVGTKMRAEQKRSAKTPGETKLSFQNFSLEGNGYQALRDLNLSVRAGEIVGIAGVEGNGQNLLLQACNDPSSLQIFSGKATLLGKDLSHLLSSELRFLGVAFFPEDRLRYGMMENVSARENFLLGHQNRERFQKNGLLQDKALDEAVRLSMEAFDVSPRNPSLNLGRFSGGNQQKFVVARELYHEPQLIIAGHPTRGVDLGSVRFIHSKLLEARERGAAVLVVSSELEELTSLCDRIFVMYQGRFIAEFQGPVYSDHQLGLAMGGKEPIL